MKNTRNAYHTSLKYLAKHDLLPQEYHRLIHPSLIWKWKQEPDDKYIGTGINAIADDQLSLHQQFAQSLPARKMFKAYLKVIQTWKYALKGAQSTQKYVRHAKDQVIETIQNVAPTIGKEKTLRLFNISQSTFQTWLLEVQYRCTGSFFHLCNKRKPNQLTKKEVRKMKELLQDDQFSHWPVISVAYYALRKGILHVSVKTGTSTASSLAFKDLYPKTGVKNTKPASGHANPMNTGTSMSPGGKIPGGKPFSLPCSWTTSPATFWLTALLNNFLLKCSSIPQGGLQTDTETGEHHSTGGRWQ